MTIYKLIFAIAAALSVAACTNPNRLAQDDTSFDFEAANAAAEEANAVSRNSPAYFTSTIGDRVLFEVDESTLTTTARGILSEQAVWLAENTGFSVVIEGHADEQGTREYNLALGERRASAVQQFLVSQGVSPSRLRTVTYGKERPLEICSQEACYAKNRRAVSLLNAGTS